MNVISTFTSLISDQWQLLRFGGSSSQDVPYKGMQRILNNATNHTPFYDPLTPPIYLDESAHSFSFEQQIYLAIALLRRMTRMMELGIWPTLKDGINELWQIGPFEAYEFFYHPAGQYIIPDIQAQIFVIESPIMFVAIILIIVAFLFTIISLVMVQGEERIMRFALINLLRCNPIQLFQNKRIMDVLSGNYRKKKDDENEKDMIFNNKVVNKLNDIVIVVNEESNKIIGVNKAFEGMFNIKEEDIVSTIIDEFFTEERFKCEGKVEKVLTAQTLLIYKDSKGNKVYLDFTNQSVAGRTIFSGRNQTETLMHEKMIADEKKRSDSMLASILPPSLVPRVQAEEKNISFAIKSVTVLFLDVVEFTPWCGSHDAQYVMRMLNIMFKEYDMITNAHKTMTKIKCIGDCYMAAGGIFDEVNQPSVHAKEVVDFGCCVIKKLLEIDEIENEKLRIRVGINTGGPIIAGVIGTEKPTFEILGPAINIAHEMESKGVPMKVHISRPVYELIYGQNFVIKERGEIEIKGEKMFTYIVDP
ncbi:Adenylate and Guanylate cyclase catalytic domain containing protein [Trichomonas vaginalis G3]|uniref:Adenylate and Guanylate cyclase catalytic domain containing protein n=1 Tax=Trichomonas vaginalis (strain ATCC PRA-98 / G3) TaxID=412133 RepID=A2DHG4_TRIV3|nr:guanylate cyclase protein [Trichomonas vaginalis G3]EAY20237.1 Adenylate and Guanylate cyclase catalytic domain containing protein [Trichomonas vaginalis G3]KAI5507732.1 guanylate cyclase protein [Trichomonas vaginalis G3]|eukprot:XP_001581223.1 Adenylate and Guanylate cyclase catalytic domain containing protein [Trichomonas vaginalis G3]